MKVEKFAVSVQWGQGLHHFLRTDHETQIEAEILAKSYINGKGYKYHKGCAPTVHIWRHCAHETCALKPKKTDSNERTTATYDNSKTT